jgi:hypothetical protein
MLTIYSYSYSSRPYISSYIDSEVGCEVAVAVKPNPTLLGGGVLQLSSPPAAITQGSLSDCPVGLPRAWLITPAKRRCGKDRLSRVYQSKAHDLFYEAYELTATRVEGKKSVPNTAIVFIEELSLLLSIAIVLITALSSLLALARNEASFARSILTFASFCAIKRDT